MPAAEKVGASECRISLRNCGYAAERAAYWGRTSTLSWLLTGPHNVATDARLAGVAREALRGGHPHIVTWLLESGLASAERLKEHLRRTRGVPLELDEQAPPRGTAAHVWWLRLHSDNSTSGPHEQRIAACRIGALAQLQELVRRHGWTRKDMREKRCVALRRARKYGHHGVAAWLVERYGEVNEAGH